MLDTLNSELTDLQTELKDLQSDTEYEIKTILLDFEEQAEQLDEKAKKVTEFVSEIGFDAIPQNISNFVFGLISESNPIQI
jgi:phage-related minor tail protein